MQTMRKVTTQQPPNHMLIFDHFPSLEHAIDFAHKVRVDHTREAIVCRNQGQSDAIDPYPWALISPIVLVTRSESIGDEAEQHIERLATKFHGTFAGT